ncbi:MAG: hypothetical protein NTZ38_00100 [Candidatus Taylorbacteria bacterium]|nr:hypothetical protein [Candidatus Taylorbacteria bacterium]
MAKLESKLKAIRLRKLGKTLSEIMREVPVAKSTIALWMKEVGLSVPQKQAITEKRRAGQRRVAEAQRNKRIKRQRELIENARVEIKKMTKRELWFVGIALYWAEGAKEKEERPGNRASFSNSDPKMIAIFIRWLRECAEIPDDRIYLDLYIHESHRAKVDEVLKKWSEVLDMSLFFFKYTYFKKNKIKTLRKNTGALYMGVLRVNIRASSDLNRKITGWIKGITEYWGIV